MTLIEMIVALTIFSFIMAGALSMLRSESKRFQLGGERAAMYQNGRFAMNEMEKDLRTSGAGAPDIQPQMVYISDSAIVFNANYWTNTPGDVEAVYYVASAPDSAVAAMRTTGKVFLPFTAIQYPDTNYLLGGVNSAAETIAFWFARDSSTARTDDFVLWRRINNLPPEVVSTNLMRTTGEPFFRYFRLTSTGTSQSLDTVPRASLPWRHTQPIHLAATDTGTAARIDSIRAVRVSFTVTNGRSGSDEQLRAITRLIRLPNVGLANTKTCGDAPIFGATINIVAGVEVEVDSLGVDSTRYVRLSFLPSVDEASGELDVERYVIFRRFGSVADWGDPLATIPGGDTLYIYNDVTVIKDSTYRFAVAAQDCTPSLSGLRETSTVTIP